MSTDWFGNRTNVSSIGLLAVHTDLRKSKKIVFFHNILKYFLRMIFAKDKPSDSLVTKQLGCYLVLVEKILT